MEIENGSLIVEFRRGVPVSSRIEPLGELAASIGYANRIAAAKVLIRGHVNDPMGEGVTREWTGATFEDITQYSPEDGWIVADFTDAVPNTYEVRLNAVDGLGREAASNAVSVVWDGTTAEATILGA